MAAELCEVAAQFVVEGPAVGQQREGVRAGLGRFSDSVRLLAEFVLGRGQLRLHVLVRLDQPRDHVHDSVWLALRPRSALR